MGNPSQSQIEIFLEGKLAGYLAVLEQMVAINSFTANPEGINELADLTGRYFADLGFTAERIPSTNPDYGDHLVLNRPGTGPASIALVSHLDTVFPADEERRNDFYWRVEDDRLYGPGSVDIKGGTVLMYMVLDALRAVDPALFEAVNWVILLNAAEETLAPDFADLCRQRIPAGALACLVFEAGNVAGGIFTLVRSRKGRATFQVDVEGRAAHAGANHQRGASAIVQLAETVSQIAALTDHQQDLTFNVGTISGGTVINRVPHLASASGEMRAFDSDIFRQGVARLEALAENVTVRSLEDGYPCRITVDVLQESAPWPQNPATDRLLSIWQETAAGLGWVVVPEARGGLSDGNFIWDYVPTLDGLGPSGANAHCSERSADGLKDQEYAEASSFVPKAALTTLAIMRLAGQPG
jgi:glutamate carboxypeptidase